MQRPIAFIFVMLTMFVSPLALADEPEGTPATPDLSDFSRDVLQNIAERLYHRVDLLEAEASKSQKSITDLSARVHLLQRQNERLRLQSDRLKRDADELRSELEILKSPPDEAAPAEAEASRPDEAAFDGYVITPSEFKVGDVEVRVTSIAIGQVPLKSISGEGRSQNEHFAIKFTLTNTSETRMVSFRTWAGADFSLGRDYASLTDNHDNVYRRIDFGIMNEVIGQTKNTNVRPGQTVTDVVVFETPVQAAKTFELTLPHGNIGRAEGTRILRIESK